MVQSKVELKAGKKSKVWLLVKEIVEENNEIEYLCEYGEGDNQKIFSIKKEKIKMVASSTFISATSAPMVALFIGIFATVLFQSSSTTTSLIVGMVSTGIIGLTNAIPMIMGANIGTTVTNTIVSIGHIRRGNEFKRAFAASTVHDFFNMMAVVILFPIEMLFHPLEKSALERTYGVPIYQDQLCELAMHVGGMSGVEGEQMRRAFTRKNNDRHIEHWRKKFIKGALKNSVPSKAAEKIFRKFHGLYQFPEAHAFAFGVTAYQMSWLKHYYPLEFFIGLFNNQPMGFYNVETLKEDAVRHKVKVLGPDVNLSGEKSHVEYGALRMGLTHVRKISTATASSILKERSATSGKGPFISLADFISRTGIPLEIVNSLSAAGALDSLGDLKINTNERSHFECNSNVKTVDRRLLRWESGLRHRKRYEKKDGSRQLAMEMPTEQDMVTLPKENEWERMIGEYTTIGMYPEGHLMAKIRSQLPAKVAKSNEVRNYANGEQISVAGLVIRRQRPSSKTIFLTLEDEFGHSPLLIWARDYKRLKPLIKQSLILARGSVSRREGTMNIIVQTIIPIPKSIPHFDSHDWS